MTARQREREREGKTNFIINQIRTYRGGAAARYISCLARRGVAKGRLLLWLLEFTVCLAASLSLAGSSKLRAIAIAEVVTWK